MKLVLFDANGGGYSKSTTSLHAAWFSAGIGLRAGWGDNDNNRHGSDMAFGVGFTARDERRRTIMDVHAHPAKLLDGALVRYDKDGSITPYIARGIPQQYRLGKPGTLDCVVGSRQLSRSISMFQPTEGVMDFQSSLSSTLRHPRVQEAFDVFFLDNGPSWDPITESAVQAADVIYILSVPSIAAVGAIWDYAGRTEEIGDLRRKANLTPPQIGGVIRSRVRNDFPRMHDLSDKMPVELAKSDDPSKRLKVMETVIPETNGIYEVGGNLRPAWVDFPDDPGSQAMIALCAEIMKQLGFL